MMQARDAAGRQVSLLNDDVSSPYSRPDPYQYAAPQRLSYSTAGNVVSQPYHHDFSRSESSSPHTPQLLRSDSYDSQMSGEPLSPMTPNVMYADYSHGAGSTMVYTAEPRTPYEDYLPDSHSHAHAHIGPGSKRPSAFPIGGSGGSRRSVSYDEDATSPSSASASTSASASAPSSERSGKRYPCRYRDSHGCDKTFTTSGHASRHSKIHTAEKAVLCTHAGCTKKFTRADNMKQHLETHYKDKGRSSSGSSRPSMSGGGRRSSTSGKHHHHSSSHSISSTTTTSSHRRVDSTPLPSPGAASGSTWDMTSLNIPLMSRPNSVRTPSGLDALAMAIACQEAGA